ncbi:PfkB family carbohydrate kinase [Desulfovibrio inopinatus]|uniref:PfkB family carbohydrate kinase n=1 Tax=Desulfovibrio inopinatus TaxID=102109 RepID=UPI0005596952|nr:PfkB family carbohydrate kinase [Desulfovibrio inopinatus]
MSAHKILSLECLKKELSTAREANTIVHCHGVFDILHPGHIRHLKQAKEMGDLLVVTITPDHYVNKGPDRPVFNAEYRAEVLAALGMVDYVSVNKWPTAVELIQYLQPHFYVKGDEYSVAEKDITGKIVDEEEAVKSVGGELKFTYDVVFSSSNLANRCFPQLSENGKKFIADFTSKHSKEEILNDLKSLQDLKVLVIGETIIDEYNFCDTLGKSGKEPIIASKLLWTEKYIGGILAIANHVGSFTDNVELVTQLGEVDSQIEFINEKLRTNITQHFLPIRQAPTIVKSRFVERYPFQKLFEVYTISNCDPTPEDAKDLYEKMEELVPQADLVIVADYGHGMLLPEHRNLLSEKAKFLAMNTQQNAGNQGFHVFSAYSRADFISISENELRLEARCRSRRIEDLIKEASEKCSCSKVLITQGEKGCICYDQETGFVKIPAFTQKVVDRIGAGDTVLSIASMCAAKGMPADVIGFLGSVAGAQAVGDMCNKSFLDKVAFGKHITSLLS